MSIFLLAAVHVMSGVCSSSSSLNLRTKKREKGTLLWVLFCEFCFAHFVKFGAEQKHNC